jgi:hypothetical protein
MAPKAQATKEKFDKLTDERFKAFVSKYTLKM